MIKDETLEYERQRVMMASELRIAPDDLDLAALLSSVFRAIRENCENNNDEIKLTIKNKQEEKAVLSHNGSVVVNRIFTSQHPFEGILDDYEDWYMSLLEDIVEGEE